MSEPELAQQLSDLVRAQILVQDSPDQFGFRHSLMRDAVYQAMLGRERRRAHREVGQALEQMAQAAAGPDAKEGDKPSAGDLALHFYFAGAWDKALDYARRAGEEAQRMFAPQEAAGFLTQALDAAQHLEAGAPPKLLLERGQAYETTGQFENALADYTAALAAARERGEMRAEWESLLALGFLWGARDYAVSGEYLQAALTIARGMNDPATLARTMNRVGNWYLNASQPFDALEIHQEALEIFRGLNDKQGLADTYDLLGIANVETNNLIASTAAYEKACALYRALDDRRGLCSAVANLAVCAASLWCDFVVPGPLTVAKSLALGREAVELGRNIGWRAGEGYAMGQLTMLYATLGDYTRAFELGETSLAIAQEIEHRQWICVANMGLGWLYLDLMAPDLAQAHLSHSLQLAREIQSPLLEAIICSVLARMHLERADPDAAYALLVGILGKRGLVDAVAANAQPSPAWTRLAVGERLCAFGYAEWLRVHASPANALELLDQLKAHTPNCTPTTTIMRLDAMRGLCLLQLDRLVEAERVLEAARQEMQSRGNPNLLWRTEAAMARLADNRGADAQARALRAHAVEIAFAIGNTVGDAALRALFLERAQREIWLESGETTGTNSSGRLA